MFAVATDSYGNTGTAVVRVPFSTLDVTPPDFIAPLPTVDSASATMFATVLGLSEPGTVYWLIEGLSPGAQARYDALDAVQRALPLAATTVLRLSGGGGGGGAGETELPGTLEVIAGRRRIISSTKGSFSPRSGRMAISQPGQGVASTLTGFADSTVYAAFFVAEDVSGNMQLQPQALN